MANDSSQAQQLADRAWRDRALRVALPAVVLLLVLLGWELVVRINAIPPYILPGPLLVLTTLANDWPILWESLLATLTTTFEGLALAFFGGVALAVLFHQSRLIEYSLLPLRRDPAGDAGGGDRAAAADLPAAARRRARLRLDRRLLPGAGEHDARPQLGRPQSRRPVPALPRLALAGAASISNCPAALPYVLGGLRIAGGLALIGAVVAEISAGSAGAGSGSCLPHRRVGLSPQHPAHVRGAAAALDRRHRDLLRAVARSRI